MNHSQMAQFIEQNNMQMLWDVLRETDTYDSMTTVKRGEFQQSVLGNMHHFYNFERTSQSPSKNLIEMNKKFIEIMISNLSKPSVNSDIIKQTDLPPLKLKQNNTNAYTSKDIQAERQTEFEHSLNKKKQDFDNTINIKKPPVPVFSDKIDEPISEMETLIAQTIAQRNFEINQIQSANSMSNANNDFLTAKETSLKTEKQRDYDNTLKYIKIEKEELGQYYDNSEVIDLNKQQNKSAKKLLINERDNETFYYNNDNSIIEDNKPPRSDNFFLKLKPAINASVNSSLSDTNLRLTQQNKSIGSTENIKITYSDINPNDSHKGEQHIIMEIKKLSDQMESVMKAIEELTKRIKY